MKRFTAFILALCALASLALASDGATFSKEITLDMELEGKAKAYDNRGENEIMFIDSSPASRGRAVYTGELPDDFTLTFDYNINGCGNENNLVVGCGTGIVVAFFADEAVKTNVAKADYFFDGCGGYGFEIDANNFDEDGSDYHVALVDGQRSNHVAKVAIPMEKTRSFMDKYHSAKLVVAGNNVTAFIDGKKMFSKNINIDRSGKLLYISATCNARGVPENHDIKNVVLSNAPDYADASDWAVSELDRASELGLIPEMLKGADMTRKITRLEFAALATKLYETITGTSARVVSTPFTDVSHDDVSKAYGLGITGGVAANRFAPDDVITREQVATMLTRALKAAIPELDTSSASVAKFADDEDISDWAKDSVYFMASKGIINGVGKNMFAPKNTTAAQTAAGYANSTVEQAIIIAARAFEKK